jgi:endonuclease YncB( thermonuclease family)
MGIKSALLALTALAVASAAPAFAGSVGRVIDGDGFCLCGDDELVGRYAGRSKECTSECVEIRLCGIDAPEEHQLGYREALRTLDALTIGREVYCTAVRARTPSPRTVCDNRSTRWSRDRLVAQCFAGGRDIAQDMVDSGNACDWSKYSGGHYSRNGIGRPCPDGHRKRLRRAR